MRPVITLLTDFGTADGYVGEIKGVLFARVAGASVVDVTHDIPPQDVEAGRLTLARVWRRFPPGTVHLAIVDPGVGGDRRALAVESDERALVGPDNGVLSPALLVAGARAVALPIPPSASATFHGRDVFAPAAAELALGRPLEALGTPVHDPVIRRTPEPHRLPNGGIQGQVISVDRFGNLVTNLVGIRSGVVEVSGMTLPLRRTYADVARGSLVALIGSSGLIEIALRDGSAADKLQLTRGNAVVFRST